LQNENDIRPDPFSSTISNGLPQFMQRVSMDWGESEVGEIKIFC
jgi:hypothetical protein